MNRAAITVALVSLAPGAATAGGLARPTLISARGVGMGGAFSAIADDASAWHFNPAGAAWIDGSVAMVGGELVVAPREYTPVAADGTRGAVQKPKTPIAPLPALGIVIRPELDGVMTRAAFGVGIWNSYGGELEYEPLPDPDSRAINSTREAVIELVPGVAYEIADQLVVGATLRLGLGLFDVNSNKTPVDAEAHGKGLGIGGSFGLMFRPIDQLTVGLVWRTPLNIKTAGDGHIGGEINQDVDIVHRQNWPQAATFAIAARPIDALRLAGQVDWTAWSRYDALLVEFRGTGSDQAFPLDWSDGWTVRGGAEYIASPRLSVRAGAYYDLNVVPDNTIERQYLDDDKLGFSAGTSVGISERLRLDLGVDVMPGGTRKVPDNSAETAGWNDQQNIAPGEYAGQFYTLELALAIRI